MKAVRLLSAICGIAFCMYAGLCQAGANTVDLYTHAILSGDVAELEKILAPNFWYIGGNGHIRDKDNFIKEIKDKTLVVDHLALKNLRETKVGLLMHRLHIICNHTPRNRIQAGRKS